MQFEIDMIVLQNFKSFRGKHLLDLKWLGPGTIRVRGFNDDNARLGSNGSGKSTFLSDAICWGLYGRTAAGLRNPDVRPWKKTKGPTIVRLHVRVGDNVVVIQRLLKPSHKLTMDEHACGQADVDRFLGMSFEVFTHTILLAQARPLFFDKAPREKMQLFSDVLLLDRWDARSKLAAERAREQERGFDRISGALETWQSRLMRIKAELPKAKARVFAWDEERQRVAASIEDVADEWRSRITKIEREHADADLALDSAGMQIKLLVKDVDKAKQAYDRAQHRYTEASAKKQGAELFIGYRRAELKNLKTGGVCPTCKQKIKLGTAAKHRAKIVDAITAAKKRMIIPDDITEAADAAYKQHAALQNALGELEQKQRDARDVLDRVIPKLENARANLNMAKARQAEYDTVENPHKAGWQRLRKEKGVAVDEVERLNQELFMLERRIARSKLWIKGFRDMRLYLVEGVLEELTIATNAALEEVGLIGWAVEYTIEKETKAGAAQQGLFVMIKSPANDKPVRWEAWSGGEGQRLRLVGSLALAEVLLSHAGLEPKIEILDEPTRHMSPEGVRDVTEYLVLRAKDTGRQIFLVDHQAVDSRAFAATVTIAKDRKGSYIVEA